MAAALKDKYETRALKEVLDEYPRLRNAMQAVQRVRGAAIQGGDAVSSYTGPSSISSVEDLFRIANHNQ